VLNVIAVARHAVRPTIGVDTTGKPAAVDYAAALRALRGVR
jgi:hypothetical protein